MEHILKDTNPYVETQFCADDDAYLHDSQKTHRRDSVFLDVEVRENESEILVTLSYYCICWPHPSEIDSTQRNKQQFSAA